MNVEEEETRIMIRWLNRYHRDARWWQVWLTLHCRGAVCDVFKMDDGAHILARNVGEADQIHAMLRDEVSA